MKNRLILISILLTFCIASTPEKKAIVLAGQSNMGKSAANIREMMPDYKIINCARGGTSIIAWQPGGEQYENCLRIVNNIKAQGYIIKGIFFFQGEKDTNNYEIARRWKLNFYRFINSFRKSIGINTPIVFAQLGPKPLQRKPYWNTIKNLQRLSQNKNGSIYMITTSDIKPYCPINSVHFCPDGYTIIATRFVQKYHSTQGE